MMFVFIFFLVYQASKNQPTGHETYSRCFKRPVSSYDPKYTPVAVFDTDNEHIVSFRCFAMEWTGASTHGTPVPHLRMSNNHHSSPSLLIKSNQPLRTSNSDSTSTNSLSSTSNLETSACVGPFFKSFTSWATEVSSPWASPSTCIVSKIRRSVQLVTWSFIRSLFFRNK